MAGSKDIIEHPGIISHIGKDYITVSILSRSACSACHAKGSCSVADLEEKQVEVPRLKQREYKTGEQVNVIMQKSLGTKAILIGYIFPFLVVVISLFVLTSITRKQGLSALISLGLLVPYYFIISLLKEKMRSTFIFRIE